MMDAFINKIPPFLDRMFGLIDDVHHDIVCWSAAGDSFIIKQVPEFERLLPLYYNHNKFLSFVRQLNVYGFRKVKAGAMGVGAGSTRNLNSWEEFRHPQFRRGRRDLLVGIKRQQDGVRSKRKSTVSQKWNILNTLAADVNGLRGMLRTANSKLDEIIFVLSDTPVGHGGLQEAGRTVPGNVPLQPLNVGGSACVVFNSVGRGGSGGTPASIINAATSAGTGVRSAGGGGSSGFVQRGVEAGMGGGVIGQVRLDPSLYAAPIGNYMATHLPIEQHQQHQQHQHLHQHMHQHLHQHQHQHQLHQRQEYPVYSQQYPPVATNQMRYQVAQPQAPLAPPPAGAAGAATHASESARTGQAHLQLPPHHGLSPPGVSNHIVFPYEQT
ncbi:unnamed protein product [Pylaiella littoralis]